MEENIKFSNIQGIGVAESRERMYKKCLKKQWFNFFLQ